MHLAARFCAKEAVAKALGLRPGASATWRWWRATAPPRVRLSGRAAARAEELGVEASVSLTHTHALAGAVALLR